MNKKMPPDPEAKNNDRAQWAASALHDFQSTTGTDHEDALTDLLCDLIHWSDRNGFDFDAELFKAKMHYEAETTPETCTPGPWSYNRDEGGIHGHVISTGDYIICELPDAGEGAAPDTEANALRLSTRFGPL